jgi:hypothetical protein
MISATNAAALDAMLASPCRKHGKRAPQASDAESLTSYGVLETASKRWAAIQRWQGDRSGSFGRTGSRCRGMDERCIWLLSYLQAIMHFRNPKR